MNQTSLTGTESFAARLLRSEQWRIALMAIALMFVLLSVIVRRWLGGVVMSSDAAFFPSAALLLAGLVYQGGALLAARRRTRVGGATPKWQQLISVVVDLAGPAAMLLVLQHRSPRGAYAALSGPSLLIMPLVILLSILRLRPWFSLGTGAGAAIAHLGLIIHATRLAKIEPEQLPVLFSYPVMLFIIGTAAAMVSWMARRYVIEAVEEATIAERSQRAIASIEQDLRVARDIQMGLLPSEHPTIAGYDVAGMARPASQAGGDYYDWQPLPDGRLVVAIADVTGHGIGPALVMAVCRAYARASAPTSTGPDALLAQLNELIYEDVRGARFITMALAILSASGEVELVSAGHGPTYLYHASSGELEDFGGDGIPLGIQRKEEYGPRRILRMESGDVLVMLTDGFFEHPRKGDEELFGTSRLADAVKASASLPPADLIAALDAAVHGFAAGAAQQDDMTAVVMKRK